MESRTADSCWFWKIIKFRQIGSGRCCVVHQGAAVRILATIRSIFLSGGNALFVALASFQMLLKPWDTLFKSQIRWGTGHWWRWSSSDRARPTRGPYRGRDTSSTHSSRLVSDCWHHPHRKWIWQKPYIHDYFTAAGAQPGDLSGSLGVPWPPLHRPSTPWH